MGAAPIEAVARPMAWSASHFESIDELGFEFQSKHCDALGCALNQVLERSLGVDDIGVVDFPLPEMQAELASLRQEVKYGRGIVIIRGCETDTDSRESCSKLTCSPVDGSYPRTVLR